VSRVTAQTLSWLFNPGCLILGLLVAGILFSHDLTARAMTYWFIALLGLTLISLGILGIAWARGMVLDADLLTPVNLRERSQILLVFVSLILMFLIASFRLGQPQPLHAVLVIILLVGVLVAAISSYWKISLHMLGTSLFVTTVLAYDFNHWWPILILLPAIAWARLRLHRHTPLQLLAGFILAALLTLLVFRAYGLV
jgi:membrane-associated phospholipid phosphatase